MPCQPSSCFRMACRARCIYSLAMAPEGVVPPSATLPISLPVCLAVPDAPVPVRDLSGWFYLAVLQFPGCCLCIPVRQRCPSLSSPWLLRGWSVVGPWLVRRRTEGPRSDVGADTRVPATLCHSIANDIGDGRRRGRRASWAVRSRWGEAGQSASRQGGGCRLFRGGGGLCFVGVCLPDAKSFFVRLGKIVYFCSAFYSITDRLEYVRL